MMYNNDEIYYIRNLTENLQENLKSQLLYYNKNEVYLWMQESDTQK